MVYVGDVKLAGPKANLAKGWALIKEEIDIEPPAGPGLFLGCVHRQFTQILPNGNKIRGIEYDNSSYFRDKCEKYPDLMEERNGKRPVLKKVHTPSVPEGQKFSPQ